MIEDTVKELCGAFLWGYGFAGTILNYLA